MNSYYNGWTIEHNPNAPITGQWKATRHGVSMCANNESMLKNMIDNKIKVERAWLAAIIDGEQRN